jgi:hypothetical protein
VLFYLPLEMKMLSSSGCSRGPNRSLGTSHCYSRRDVSDSGLKEAFFPVPLLSGVGLQ